MKRYQRRIFGETGCAKVTGFFILFSYTLFFNVLYAQTIEENIVTQLEIYPQEKIHLHTDRDFYVPGEKIWFKAYVVDAHTHLYPNYSRYVYAELIDERDSLVSRVMILPENELFYGHLFLADIILEGNYTLRAYTRYLENLGDDYFFKKNIRIGNISGGNRENRGNGGNGGNRGIVQDDFDVSFFPEGGNLLEGAFCRIAFKALNRSGYPESISGIITNETGAEITSVQTLHAGMGMFTFIPESGKKYILKCRNGNGLEKQFELPQASPQAYSLTASWRNRRLFVGLQQSIHAPDISCYVLVHNRGKVLYLSEWDKSKENIVFTEEQLPAGVIQLVLFDAQMNGLSERLVFSKNDNQAMVEFRTNKNIYEKRENVISTLSLTDSGGNILLPGHLSVAVTDDKDITVDYSTTILSSLLLSSELRRYIENPAYYLQDKNESVIALDYLMMTHGWRRYNIPDVVKGKPEYPQIPFQTSQEISGKVKSLLLSKPVVDSEISIMTGKGFLGLTPTDTNGAFRVSGFEFPDSTAYFVQALGRKGSDRVELLLDGEAFPKLIHAPQSPYLTPALSKGEGGREGERIGEEMKNETDPNAFIMKAEQRSKYDENMRVIHLSEVEVTAPRIERKDEPRLQFPLNEGSDITIPREVFEQVSLRLVSEYLTATVPGLRVIIGEFGAHIYFTSAGALNPQKTSPLFVIDGIIWPDGGNALNQFSPSDIESIDVFKGPSAALFGSRGAYGVISITTRRGLNSTDDSNRNQFNFTVYTPLGYQKPVEFYSPTYETLDAKHLTIPDYRTTIFWKPDIVVSDDGKASFDFYTSDYPTTYSVVIEGLTTDGRIVRQVEKIQVE